MRHFSFFIGASLLLASCGSGISKESSRPHKGAENGVVLVEEFADFECPFCAPTHTGVVIPIVEQYGAVVRYEWKHLPLRSIHRYAMDAAEASECAADQGKFWEYVDLMFAEQDRLSDKAFTDWARALGLDLAIFEKCQKSHAKRGTILEDYEEGRKRGVSGTRGTPTFFVNGKRVEPGFDTLSAAIEEVLKGYEMRL